MQRVLAVLALALSLAWWYVVPNDNGRGYMYAIGPYSSLESCQAGETNRFYVGGGCIFADL